MKFPRARFDEELLLVAIIMVSSSHYRRVQ